MARLPKPSQKATQLARLAIVQLEELLVQTPPAGTTVDDVVDLFRRHRSRLVKALASLLEDLNREPRCTICRHPRGTNPACDRCKGFAWMRDHPFTAEKRAEARAAAQEKEAAQQAIDRAHCERLSGRLVRVALVGCGKAKAPTAQPAKDLYVGMLFKAARSYAELLCDDWLTLSAFYGVLAPEQIVEPYDRNLSAMRLVEREAWGHRVSSSLNARYRGLRVQYVGLAGAEYLEHLHLNGAIDRPLDGMGVGSRVRYLRDAVREVSQPPQPNLDDSHKWVTVPYGGKTQLALELYREADRVRLRKFTEAGERFYQPTWVKTGMVTPAPEDSRIKQAKLALGD